jgi:2,3,4,5-tetrahydropyridine-2-carboxylate N-succinyltransferase
MIPIHDNCPPAWKETAAIITQTFAKRDTLSSQSTAQRHHLQGQLEEVLVGLESGALSVAQQQGDLWLTAAWIKQAILLYFQLMPIEVLAGSFSNYADKIPLRFQDAGPELFERLKTRVVPPACVRRGAYLGPNTVIMPSFINIGAYVGEGTLVDTWATVGSCAYIGKRVHLSGGAGIGGVLEPLQANPTIIEDDCFIGARSEIVEGVTVGQGAIIGMGVFIGQSTKIYDRATGEIYYGRVPPYSVVVPGQLPSADGKYSLSCAVIVKQVDEKTRKKTAINDLLRQTD